MTELFIPVVTIHTGGLVSVCLYVTMLSNTVLPGSTLYWILSTSLVCLKLKQALVTDPHHVNPSLRSQAFKSNVLNKKCENIFTRERNNVDWPLSPSSIPQRRTVRQCEEPNHIFLFATLTMKCRMFHVTLDKKRTFKRFLLDLAVECILIDCIHSHALS